MLIRLATLIHGKQALSIGTTEELIQSYPYGWHAIASSLVESLQVFMETLTEYCGFNNHLHKTAATNNATCGSYKIEDQLIERVLCECPGFVKI